MGGRAGARMKLMHVNMHAWACIAGVVGQRSSRSNSSGASGHFCCLLPWNQPTSAAALEPLCRCHTASLWAHIDKIYYASTYDDVLEYGK